LACSVTGRKIRLSIYAGIYVPKEHGCGNTKKCNVRKWHGKAQASNHRIRNAAGTKEYVDTVRFCA
jgi:hypothetical protein